MRALEKSVFALSIISLGVFGSLKAQTSNDNLIAFNTASGADTEIVKKVDPVFEEGTSGAARNVSFRNPAIVLFISGGKDPKYSAEDYGKMFQAMFKDSKYTKLPADIYVRYEESGKDRPTMASVFLGGTIYDKNGGKYEGGDGVFTPMQLIPHIENITKQHAKNTGVVLLENTTNANTSLASNSPNNE